jgi:uncharacterized protein (TIGR02452 family)
MASRHQRAAIAAETVQVLSAGSYTAPSGKTISILSELNHAVHETRLFAPGALARIAASAPAPQATPQIQVTNCTTLSAARQLHAANGTERVAPLNFASARNPGGGFLSGSQAQEESLARASGLYACLSRMTGYYAANRRERSALYTDHMIYSPLVPVFRDDDDRLLEEPWSVSMITAPAVNAGVVRSREPENVARMREVMSHRIACVLGLAAHHGHDALVLGAWGCGVFGNDPGEVAELFAGQLLGQGRYSTAFTEVVFAILDRRGDSLRPFAAVFGSSASSDPKEIRHG